MTRKDVHFDTDTFPVIYNQIARQAQTFINSLGRDVVNDEIQQLAALYSLSPGPSVNYDEFASIFTYAYFLENFWKSSTVFWNQPPPLTKNVMDVGCGSGATALAFLATLDITVPANIVWHVHVILVDRSPIQLHIATRIIDALREHFKHLSISYESVLKDYMEYRRPLKTNSILLGHVLTENQERVGQILERTVEDIQDGGRIHIIERTDDPVWNSIGRYLHGCAIPFEDRELEMSTKYLEDSNWLRFERKNTISSRSVFLQIPDSKNQLYLVRAYFEAWRTQSERLLDEIFSADARYHEKPFDLPIKGIKEIKMYWRRTVKLQRNIDLQILSVAYVNEQAFVEWSAKFRKPQQSVQMKGVLILRIDPESNKVTSLREYFRTFKVGL